MKNRIERIRAELKEKDYSLSKVCNYTGLSMKQYFDLTEDREVDLSENLIWCLELRLFQEKGSLLR